jgi:hypothetical protein
VTDADSEWLRIDEIEMTSCDFTFRGWPDPDDLEPDPDPPRRARPQKVRIDLERHQDYLESP